MRVRPGIPVNDALVICASSASQLRPSPAACADALGVTIASASEPADTENPTPPTPKVSVCPEGTLSPNVVRVAFWRSGPGGPRAQAVPVTGSSSVPSRSTSTLTVCCWNANATSPVIIPNSCTFAVPETVSVAPVRSIGMPPTVSWSAGDSPKVPFVFRSSAVVQSSAAAATVLPFVYAPFASLIRSVRSSTVSPTSGIPETSDALVIAPITPSQLRVSVPAPGVGAESAAIASDPPVMEKCGPEALPTFRFRLPSPRVRSVAPVRVTPPTVTLIVLSETVNVAEPETKPAMARLLSVPETANGVAPPSVIPEPATPFQSSGVAPVPLALFTSIETPVSVAVASDPIVSEPVSPVACTAVQLRPSGVPGVSDAIVTLEPAPPRLSPNEPTPICSVGDVSEITSSDAPVSAGVVTSTSDSVTAKVAVPVTKLSKLTVADPARWNDRARVSELSKANGRIPLSSPAQFSFVAVLDALYNAFTPETVSVTGSMPMNEPPMPSASTPVYVAVPCVIVATFRPEIVAATPTVPSLTS